MGHPVCTVLDDIFKIMSSHMNCLCTLSLFSRARWGASRGGEGGGPSCDMSSEQRQTPWEHGADIARALRAVKIRGLSGDIR